MSTPRAEATCVYREEKDDARLEIWDEDGRRSLWFDDVILQSEIDLRDPRNLPNPVNRAMLAPLLYDLPVRRVLLAGCGGGAVARWFHARAPQVWGDAVEVSPTVARLAHQYFDFPPADSHWRLLPGDVRDHLAQEHPVYDYILVDLAERQQTPDWTFGRPFLSNCLKRLSDTGMTVINLISPSVDDAAGALFKIRQVFQTGIHVLGNPEHDNLLVLASRRPPGPPPASAVLTARGRRWGLDFPDLARRLRWIPPPAP